MKKYLVPSLLSLVICSAFFLLLGADMPEDGKSADSKIGKYQMVVDPGNAVMILDTESGQVRVFGSQSLDSRKSYEISFTEEKIIRKGYVNLVYDKKD